LAFEAPWVSVIWVAALEISGGGVVAVRSILNPDKLARVAPVPVD
jgi:hypothetical protein